MGLAAHGDSEKYDLSPLARFEGKTEGRYTPDYNHRDASL